MRYPTPADQQHMLDVFEPQVGGAIGNPAGGAVAASNNRGAKMPTPDLTGETCACPWLAPLPHLARALRGRQVQRLEGRRRCPAGILRGWRLCSRRQFRRLRPGPAAISRREQDRVGRAQRWRMRRVRHRARAMGLHSCNCLAAIPRDVFPARKPAGDCRAARRDTRGSDSHQEHHQRHHQVEEYRRGKRNPSNARQDY